LGLKQPEALLVVGAGRDVQKLLAQARNQHPNIGKVKMASIKGFLAEVRPVSASMLSNTNHTVAHIAVARNKVNTPNPTDFGTL
jgi:hypothetical protein